MIFGLSYWEVQEIKGSSNRDITVNVYIHVQP